MTGLGGAPFFYAGAAPPSGNLFTNTSIRVSQGLDGYPQLDRLLNTPAVGQRISAGLRALGERQPCRRCCCV